MTELRVDRDDASAPYFDAARSGRLLIRRCTECGRLFPPQQRTCTSGHALEWAPASGSAVLVSWTVEHGPPLSSELLAADGASSVAALVELAEGPWMYTAMPGVDPAELRDGQAMSVQFISLGAGEPVPVFAPS